VKVLSSVKVMMVPVSDYWIVPTAGHDMVSFSFHVTRQQLEGLHLGVSNSGSSCHLGSFEMVFVLTWHAGHDPRTSRGGAYVHSDHREGQRGIRTQ
jgi:hypothetical protein